MLEVFKYHKKSQNILYILILSRKTYKYIYIYAPRRQLFVRYLFNVRDLGQSINIKKM